MHRFVVYFFVPGWLALIFCTGCERKEVRVYVAPKDVPPEETKGESPAHGEPGHQHSAHEDAAEPWRPQLTWTLPADWKELSPDKANLARFSTAGEAQVAITALASMEGQEALLVNMYRQIKGEAPLEDSQAAKQLQDATIAGGAGKVLEVSEGKQGQARRFLVAFIHRDEGSLFFKIEGQDEVVLKQKPAFLEFLKTIKIAKASKPAAAPEPAPIPGPTAPELEKESESAPKLTLPEGWTQLQPGAMQVAKFAVTAAEGKAEVAVSVFPSDTGGTAANVQRWRGQLGLPSVSNEEALRDAVPLPGGPKDAVLINLENGARALCGTIVPKSGQWFFFKMTGDTAAVKASRDAFVKFVNSAP